MGASARPEARFSWDAQAGRYRDAMRGRFVSREEVKRATLVAQRAASRRIARLGVRVSEGEITVAEWQAATAQELKSAALYSASAARGGWAQMTQADYGRVGAHLREQYKYLGRFARQLANGDQVTDGSFHRRVQMYADAAAKLYEGTMVEAMTDAGYTQYRNVLHPADHCDGCLDAAGAGWVAIGTLDPIGERDCMTADRCTWAFR